MRLRVGCLLFFLGALLAACGGGGKSGIVPGVPQQTGGAPAPAQTGDRQLAVVLKIPPANQQSHARRPFFVSTNTQSIVFAVVPNGSGTPTPAQEQIFPVATPSPCATTTAGGETCSFNVAAPYGTDIFYVATFAVPSPNASSSPLASFVSGAIAIASPGAAPSPLAFTMNGIVANVVITVPSPDPNNTPNTQVFLAGVAATPIPLGITPYDASGGVILSDAFLVPVILGVTPAGDGVGMTLNATCTGATSFSTPSPIVNVACASDLANVKLVYSGSITADSNDHVVDTFAVTAEQSASPAPSPANIVLASNVQSNALATSASGYNTGYLQTLPNNVIAYMLMSTSLTTAEYGTINVSTGTGSTPITLNGTTPSGFYTMSDGSVWVTDRVNDELLCFTAGSGTATATVPLSSSMSYASDVTFDGTKLWVSGNNASPAPSPDVVAYGSSTGTCTIGALASSALTGDTYADNDLLMAPMTSGGVLINGVGDGGAWTVTPSGVATFLSPGFTPGSAFGGGVGIDATGVGYFLFNNETTGTIMTLPSGGSSLSQLLTVPIAQYRGLAVFGPNGGAADRLGYADEQNGVLGVVEGPNSATPITILTTLGYAEFLNYGQSVAISTKGAGLVVYLDQTSDAVTLARTEFTSTWWVPVTTLPLNNILSIDERGDSGPFTVTAVGTPPSCFSSIAPVPNTDHDFYINTVSGPTCVMPLKVTDKNGRSQTVTVTAQYNAG
ncbi:MAG: hypothetical protein WB491_01035 [Candidatus Aquilonibacter sp.]